MRCKKWYKDSFYLRPRALLYKLVAFTPGVPVSTTAPIRVEAASCSLEEWLGFRRV